MRQHNRNYALLLNAYLGNGMFEHGGGLVRHDRESDTSYRKRQEMAYYLNHTGPIVNASVDPIFKDDIKREYANSDLFAAFYENVDGRHSSLQDFIRRNAYMAKLFGALYIIVDNAAEVFDDDIINVQEGRYPFLRAVYPSDVVEWEFDEVGHLAKFAFHVRQKNSEKGVDIKKHVWTNETFAIYSFNDKLESLTPNPLAKIPVVTWYGRSTDPIQLKPVSEYLSIAQTNFHVYQLCSYLTQLMQQQTFNILTMPDPGNERDITIGVNNVLTYPVDATHTPSFIAPDSGPATMLLEIIDKLIKEMYRMSGVDAVVGVQESKSGVAKQWDFERTNQRLADFAVQCEQAEYAIIALFEEWTGVKTNYSCEYPRDFKINDVADSLAQAQQAIDLNVNSKTFKLEIVRKILSTYMANIAPEVYEAIVAEVETAADVIEQAQGNLGGGANDDPGDD